MNRGIRKVAVSAAFLIAAAAFLGCQSDTVEPTATDVPVYDDGYGFIYGYVKKAPTEEDIGGANVTWSANDDFLGSATTSPAGYYQVNAQSWWEDYDGYYLEGLASCSGYENGHNYITSYNFGQSYRRDFYLDPE